MMVNGEGVNLVFIRLNISVIFLLRCKEIHVVERNRKD